MKCTLEGPNVFPLEAATGQEGLMLYQANRVGLTIFDLPTASKDSLEAISQIRALDSQAKIVIMALATQSAAVASALELGAYDYIEKPFSQYQFRERIYNILQIQANRPRLEY